MTLSTILIVKNGEELIADCLDSVSSFSDEVIVVDSGSIDRTTQIAERLGAKVFTSASDDFAELRNFGLSKSTKKLVFYIDVDERVGNTLSNEIKKIKESEDVKDYYIICRKNFYLGKHEWPKTEAMERLFKKDKLKGWRGKLHESPQIDGECGQLNGELLHFTHSDLSSMLAKTITWSDIEAETRFKSNHPKMSWWRFPRVMLSTFFDYYLKQGGYKVGTAGLVESLYQSFSTFITYAKLWELQQEEKVKK